MTSFSAITVCVVVILTVSRRGRGHSLHAINDVRGYPSEYRDTESKADNIPQHVAQYEMSEHDRNKHNQYANYDNTKRRIDYENGYVDNDEHDDFLTIEKPIESQSFDHERINVDDEEEHDGKHLQQYNERDVGYNEYCIDPDVTFYRHFDDAVQNITGGITIDNTNKHECLYIGETFVLSNCSNLNVLSVPTSLRKELSGLDLSHNDINVLGDTSFNIYPKMQYLSLAYNILSQLSVRSFDGLSQLLVLDLRGNRLYMKAGVYPNGVFKPLTSLVALRINRNNQDQKDTDLSYPHKALSDLKSLRFLSMDGVGNKTFGEGFAKLEKLETLSLSGYTDGYCNISALTKETFQFLTQLKMLNVSDCHLKGDHDNIDPDVLHPLTNLHTLDFNWNQYLTLQKISKLIKVLHSSNLKELFMMQIEARFHIGSKINSSHDLLPENLTCLVASDNSISYLDQHIFNNIPKTLRYLDYSGNKNGFGQYIKGLSTMKSLKVLKLNGCDTLFTIPTSYSTTENNSLLSMNAFGGFTSLQLDGNDIAAHQSKLVLPIPPNLTILTLEYAGLRYKLTELNLSENNSLEELYLEYNYLPKLIGPFNGFSKLKILVIKFSAVTYISRHFFETFPALEFLDLSKNLIGQGTSLNKRPFQTLSSLTYLDLSLNAISHLKYDTFFGLHSLKELYLGSNPFYNFNANIFHMTHLEILDLYDTSINSLHVRTRDAIDSLDNITIYMSKTPLYCSCSNINFLNWFARTNAIPKNSDGFVCFLNDRNEMLLSRSQFISNVKILGRECVANHSLFLIVLGVTLLALGVIVACIMYRFRWRLRYFYYGLHFWMSRTNADKNDHAFNNDVFISYSNEDLNFVMRKVCPELHKRGLTTHIHSRDFRAGDNVISNIIRAVKVSKKTLVVLTNNFISSKWCRAEFQMAKEEALVSGRNILVFLIVDKIPKNKIGLELLTHIQQNTYLPYDGEVDNSQPLPDENEDVPCSSREMAMWDKLARDINT